MTRALVVVALAALSACGPSAAGGDGLDLNLVVSRGLLDSISSFQVSLVTQGTSLDCVQVQKDCIKNKVDAARFVPLKDSAGVMRQALRFDINLTPGSPNTQDVSLKDLPLGRDYALVVEALSRETPPRLFGSSCNYVKELTAGTNNTVFAKIEILPTPAACDPTL
jgi:hypothetical protein